MTEAEMWELIRRAREQGIPLNDAQKRAIEEYLRGRLSPQSAKDFAEDFASKPKPAPRPPWWKRLPWKNAARGTVYAALAYLLIAAVHDRTVKHVPIAGGKGPCNIAAGQIKMSADPSAPGPNGALEDALTGLNARCAAAPLACAPGAGICPTCAPDFAVQNVDIKNRIFWYTAVVDGICQCWCL